MNQVTSSSSRSRAPAFAFIALLALLMVLIFKMIAPYLIALLMGQILALIAQTPYRWLRTKLLGRYTAAAIVAAAMLVIVVGPLVGFTIVAGRQAMAFGQWIAHSDHGEFLAAIDALTKTAPVTFVLGENQDLMQIARDQMESVGSVVSGVILNLARETPEAILQLFLAALAGFYLLVDRERFSTWLKDKLPFDRNFREQVGTAFRDTAISVVWASMAAAAAQAAIMTAGFAALNIPGAFLAGGATFVFAWVPLLGSMPAMAAGAIYLFANAMYGKLIVLLIIGSIAGVADNFVRPIVLRGRGEMHPLVSLVAIFGGINLFGIFGVFVGPILAAVLITLLQLWPIVGRRAGFEFGD